MQKAKAVNVDDRVKLFVDLVTVVAQYNLKALAERAGVSAGTLRNWVDGRTLNPHILTMVKVARACDLELIVRRRSSRAEIRRIK